MELTSLASLDIYDKRLDLRSDSFVLGKDTELWVKALNYGQSVPDIQPIEFDAAVVAEDTTASLKLGTGATVASLILYRGDVLQTANALIVIAETTTITTTAAAVPILPAEDAVTDATVAHTYGLLPVLSIIDGGGLEFSNTEAEANNRSQGVWSAVKTVGRKATTSLTGSLIVTDPAVELFTELSLGSRNLYCENRYSPYVEFTLGTTTYVGGAGPGAWSFEASVSSSMPNPGNEFIKVNATLNVSGRPARYAPLVVA